MLNQMRSFFSSSHRAKIASVYFLSISAWWISMYLRSIKSGFEADLYTNIYGLLALFGGILGISVSRKWGGTKSLFGQSLFFISLGLLFQFLGQISYNTYIYIFGVDVPYPSLGDIGYFGSVIFYIIGTSRLFKVLRSKNDRSFSFDRIISIFLPLVLLAGSYYVHVKNYAYQGVVDMALLLDFGYPLGQAIYVSLALLVFLSSRKSLGGIMKKPMLFFLFALVFQYFCDFIFLYQAHRGTWYVAGVNDYMYFFSYFIMTLALGYIGYTYESFKNQVKNITV